MTRHSKCHARRGELKLILKQLYVRHHAGSISELVGDVCGPDDAMQLGSICQVLPAPAHVAQNLAESGIRTTTQLELKDHQLAGDGPSTDGLILLLGKEVPQVDFECEQAAASLLTITSRRTVLDWHEIRSCYARLHHKYTVAFITDHPTELLHVVPHLMGRPTHSID